MTDPAGCLWRLGARPYRSIYAMVPGGVDIKVGSVATAELAAMIVAQHNADPVLPTVDGTV